MSCYVNYLGLPPAGFHTVLELSTAIVPVYLYLWLWYDGHAMVCILTSVQSVLPVHYRQLKMCNWVSTKPLPTFFQWVDGSKYSAEESEVIGKVQRSPLVSHMIILW